MNKANIQLGFSTVELLVALLVAAAFLISGYQLYSSITKDGGEARMKSSAGNLANDFIQRYKGSATGPCTTSTPVNNQSYDGSGLGLSNVTVSVNISCPYPATTSISKITATVNYGTPTNTISTATYVKKP